jgi:hypothetical protein
LSDIRLGYDHASKEIELHVNGQKLEDVAAVNVAVSTKGSACTVVFETGKVDITALIKQLMLAEEAEGEN